MNEQLRRAERGVVEQFGETGERISRVSAPGRVNLIGGHTDYNEGVVLPMAIDRRVVVAGRPRDDETVRVHSLDFDQTVTFDLGSTAHIEDCTWANYVMGVAVRLRDRGHDLGGAELVVNGDVPMGGGLSSSAALEVSVAEGFAALHDLQVDAEELVAVCWEAETEFVGVGCGIMDQYTSVFGKADSALFLDCRARDHEVIPFPADQASVIATDTNVQHELADSAYNDRVASCQEGVDLLDDALDVEVSALADVSVEAFETHAASLPETVRKRVRHVVYENERVRKAADALRASDFDRVGDLLTESHVSLRDDYEVSASELDAVVDVAADQAGVFGSRMTGAGFGGCAISLVRPDRVESATSGIREGYRDRTGIEADVYACNPDGGVRRHVGDP